MITRRALAVLAVLAAPLPLAAQAGVDIDFVEDASVEGVSLPADFAEGRRLTPAEKERVRYVAANAEGTVRRLMPTLDDRIHMTVILVDRELAIVGGVTGRADAPGEILLELSTTFEGGVEAQVPALEQTLLHEMHHLVRGWTMTGNRFGPGIPIAAVNEGLATVFAEEQTGRVLPSDELPEDIHEWAREILTLPVDANYGEWMFRHPDGRLAIGYRSGRYIVRRAMERSGLGVLELSERSPAEILELAELDAPAAPAAPAGGG